MDTEGSGASRAGGDGIHNEDVFVAESGLGLYVVCDGASGTPAGETAARVAADALESYVEQARTRGDLAQGSVAPPEVVQRAMRRAFEAVAEAGGSEPDHRGPSTTITMLLAQGDLGVIGHSGDSRAYLVRRGRGHQLTIDHEMTDAAENHADGPLSPDVFTLELRPRDTVVLCTDGAERVMDDAALLRATEGLAPRILASRIVGAANRESPDQDATAVVIRVRGEGERGWLELSAPPRRTAFGHVLDSGDSPPTPSRQSETSTETQ